MKWNIILPLAALPFIIGLAALVGLPAYASTAPDAPIANPAPQQDDDDGEPPAVVTVEVTREIEVTRVVTVVVTPTFTPIPPTPTPPSPEELVDDDPFLGSEDALVKVVEFSDFQCGFCGRFATETLPGLIDHYGDLIQFVYRDFPIFGDPSVFAAVGSECVADQDTDAFWDFHDAVFANLNSADREAITVPFLEGIVTDLDLDLDEWTTCFSSEESINEVADDYVTAVNLGITGTPAFYINDMFVSGAQPLEVFFQVIDEQLIAQGIEPPARDN